jgi:hypothetical protein
MVELLQGWAPLGTAARGRYEPEPNLDLGLDRSIAAWRSLERNPPRHSAAVNFITIRNRENISIHTLENVISCRLVLHARGDKRRSGKAGLKQAWLIISHATLAEFAGAKTFQPATLASHDA